MSLRPKATKPAVLVSSGCCNQSPSAGWLKQYFFLTALEAGKCKTNVLADGGEKMMGSKSPDVSSYQGPNLMTSSKLHSLPNVPSPNIITLGIRDSTHEYWWRGTIQCLEFSPCSSQILVLSCEMHSFHPKTPRRLNSFQEPL